MSGSVIALALGTIPAMRLLAVTRPYTKPEHAALRSIAPHRSPRRAATSALVAGTVRSGVVVHNTRRSTSDARQPA